MRGVGSTKVDEYGVRLGDHRCTPLEIWEVALEAIGADKFDLDPASNEHATVPAHAVCTGPKIGGVDGLTLQWSGNVWLNFPFSQPSPWVEKVQHEADRMLRPDDARHARSITVLGPGDSGVVWWRVMRGLCDARALWPKRVHFPLPGQMKGSAPGPVHLWYIGPRSNHWRRVFEAHGAATEAGAIG